MCWQAAWGASTCCRCDSFPAAFCSAAPFAPLAVSLLAVQHASPSPLHASQATLPAPRLTGHPPAACPWPVPPVLPACLPACLQYVPVMGLDGNPSMMAFLGGMQGMPMGLPPMGPDGQVLPPDAAAAAMAAAAAAGGEARTGGGEERAAKRPRREGEEGGPTSSTEEEGQERRSDKVGVYVRLGGR